jgi:hypothetical protein
VRQAKKCAVRHDSLYNGAVTATVTDTNAMMLRHRSEWSNGVRYPAPGV